MKIVEVNNKLKSKGMKIFFIAIYFIITFPERLCKIFQIPNEKFRKNPSTVLPEYKKPSPAVTGLGF